MGDSKEILKLAADIANHDIEELLESYRRRILILDSQIDAFRDLENAFVKRLSLFDDLLTKFEADIQICGRLNLLAIGGAKNAGDQETKKEKRQRQTEPAGDPPKNNREPLFISHAKRRRLRLPSKEA